jgi:hypothetical protein
MKITASKGVANIECGAFNYSNIRGLYTSGDGHSFQNEKLQQTAKIEAFLLCKIIAELVYRLADINEKAEG